MKHEPAAIQPPTTIGTPLEGGFYVGRFRIGEQLFALIVSPREAGGCLPEPWHPEGADVPGARSCCDGLANTDAMAAVGSPLAQAIRKLDIGGFSDWYLPSRDELELMYRNLKPTTQENWASFRDGDNPSSVPAGYPYSKADPTQTTAEAFRAGGAEALDDEWHWSSTQYSADLAWSQHFAIGDQAANEKDYEGRARAVRRFLIT